MPEFNFSVCGGTFDLLHDGHKQFIKQVFDNSHKVLIGITSDKYIALHKPNQGIEKFETRKEVVEEYLKELGVYDRAVIVAINTPYDPNLETDPKFDAIFVTSQTKGAAQIINAARKKNNLPQLKLKIVEMKKAEDGQAISSTKIRNGQFTKEGKVFIKNEWLTKNLMLPESLRSVFQNPWGEVLKEVPSGFIGTKTVVVGDATVRQFNEKGGGQLLSIVDFFINRKKEHNSFSDLGFRNVDSVKIVNPAGTITSSLLNAVLEIFRNKNNRQNVLLIDGEDDLAVLPVLLAAPLGFSVYYGQPGAGIVEVKVTKEVKSKAFEEAKKFILA